MCEKGTLPSIEQSFKDRSFSDTEEVRYER